jgi:hypothetical protein
MSDDVTIKQEQFSTHLPPRISEEQKGPNPEKLLGEYGQVNENVRTLADIRFKLLALVPALGGAANFVLSGFALSKETTAPPHALVFVVGVIGFLATLGITLYDQRNSELYNALIGRAKDLEEFLDLHAKGQFRQRPDRSRYLFGLFAMGHDIGLAVIYGPALGAWAFPVVYVIYTFLQARLHWGGNPRYVALGVALLMGIIFTLELLRQDKSLPWQTIIQEGKLTEFNKDSLKLNYDRRNHPGSFEGEMTPTCKKQVEKIGLAKQVGKLLRVYYKVRRTKTLAGQIHTKNVITRVECSDITAD